MFVPVNSRYRILDIALTGVSMKAVLRVFTRFSEHPGNVAGTTFLTFLIERFNQRAPLAKTPLTSLILIECERS